MMQAGEALDQTAMAAMAAMALPSPAVPVGNRRRYSSTRAAHYGAL